MNGYTLAVGQRPDGGIDDMAMNRWNTRGIVRAGLCAVPEDYYHSSAKFYYDGTNSFGMLKHYSGIRLASYLYWLETRRGRYRLGTFFGFEEGTCTLAQNINKRFFHWLY